MSLLRNAFVVGVPFVLGVLLGFLVLPADGRALERTDFAGISQLGDPECARLAREAGSAFIATAFRVFEPYSGASHYCDLSATPRPRTTMAPRVSFGKARAYFASVDIIWEQ